VIKAWSPSKQSIGPIDCDDRLMRDHSGAQPPLEEMCSLERPPRLTGVIRKACTKCVSPRAGAWCVARLCASLGKRRFSSCLKQLRVAQALGACETTTSQS